MQLHLPFHVRVVWLFSLLYLRICVKQLLSRQTLHDCSSSRVVWTAEMYARSSTPAGATITAIRRDASSRKNRQIPSLFPTFDAPGSERRRCNFYKVTKILQEGRTALLIRYLQTADHNTSSAGAKGILIVHMLCSCFRIHSFIFYYIVARGRIARLSIRYYLRASVTIMTNK